MSRFATICLPLLLAAACAGTEPAAPGGQEDQPARTADTAAGPEVERNPLRNAYFGDFHVHSSWSLDAYSLGANRNDPAMAYRFGRGEEVNTADGRVLRLRAPLDFMAVTDHDIWLGTVNLCLDESDAVPEWGGSSVAIENRPERLREWLKTACSGDCRVLAIPHNSNLSGGSAFVEFAWIPYTPATLRLRAWAEPLVEIHQIKGNSECYLGLGTTDETWMR